MPTDATVKSLDKLAADLSKKYNVPVSWEAGEERYVSFKFTEKAKS